ncbi:MAG: hypothetical protein ABI867_36785 [Kofleriaceae bacterium]
MSRELSRIQKLAWRVGWLDRHRRMVAVVCATIIGMMLLGTLDETAGADWPQIHATLLSAMVGMVVWCVIEVGLVWLTALWETECARLIGDRGLPRAVVRKG